MFCEEGKPSIHCIGQSDICQMGQKVVSRQDTRYPHNTSGLSTLWDNYLTDTAIAAMAAGHEISMDQRTNERGEEYLGTPTFTQTLIIRTTSGHTAKIQTIVTQESNFRRHVLPTSSQRNSTSTCRSSQSNTSTRPLCGSTNSTQCSPCFSF